MHDHRTGAALRRGGDDRDVALSTAVDRHRHPHTHGRRGEWPQIEGTKIKQAAPTSAAGKGQVERVGVVTRVGQRVRVGVHVVGRCTDGEVIRCEAHTWREADRRRVGGGIEYSRIVF